MVGSLRYWEDFVAGTEDVLGPFRIEAHDVERYIELSHETHLIHTDDAFARSVGMPGCIVPGGLVHLKAGAEVRKSHGAAAVLALRWTHYDFLSPLMVGEAFSVVARVASKEPVDATRGIVQMTHRITADAERVITLATINCLMVRGTPRD